MHADPSELGLGARPGGALAARVKLIEHGPGSGSGLGLGLGRTRRTRDQPIGRSVGPSFKRR